VAVNADVLNINIRRRASERNFYLAAAILFPVLVFGAYFRSYYFRPLFTDKPLASWMVHAHGLVMSVWVLYFSAQIALIRTKNYKLHMSLGLVSIVLAALVVVVGFLAAYDMHVVRYEAPGGIEPYSFFLLPISDLFFFVLFLAGAIYWRKRPAEHKSLMLMTAINFLPPALGRLQPLPPQFGILWSLGVPSLVAVGCLLWHARRHGRVNRIFAAAVLVFVLSYPGRIVLAKTELWHNAVAAIAPETQGRSMF